MLTEYMPQKINVAILLCTAGALGILLWIIRRLVLNVPGPFLNKISSWNIIWHDASLRRNEKIYDWHRQYGPIVCIAPGEVSVASLDATKLIYSSTMRFEKSDYFDFFGGENARSMFATKTFQQHKHKRKLTSNFYQASNIYTSPNFESVVRANVHAVLRYIESGTYPRPSVDVYALTDWYAFDNITELAFGPKYRSQALNNEGEERHILKHLKMLQIWGPLRVRFPGLIQVVLFLRSKLQGTPSLLETERHLAKWSYARVTQAVKDPELPLHDCLLTRLLKAGEMTDGGKSGSEKVDLDYINAEVLDNINAAEATVAVTATYILYHLSVAIPWQREVRRELLALKSRSDGLPPFSDINSLPMLEACIKEVYRLNPAVSGRAERVVPRDGALVSGVFLPGGTIVSNSVTSIHNREELFPNSGAFVPERWLDSSPERLSVLEAHLMPFGYGARICLGRALTTMELKLLLAGIYTRYETTLLTSTTSQCMHQTSTHDAVPNGLRCEIIFRKVMPSD